MKLADAQHAARDVVRQLGPWCERIEVAGSVRREREEVGDLEIVCVPRSRDMMEFYRVVKGWRKVKGEPSGRYTRRALGLVEGETLCLDLFICNPATWGCNLLIRTGSVSFSQAVVAHAHTKGLQFREAQLWKCLPDGLFELVPTPEEGDVFRVLGLVEIEPPARQSQFSLKFLPRGKRG